MVSVLKNKSVKDLKSKQKGSLQSRHLKTELFPMINRDSIDWIKKHTPFLFVLFLFEHLLDILDIFRHSCCSFSLLIVMFLFFFSYYRNLLLMKYNECQILQILMLKILSTDHFIICNEFRWQIYLKHCLFYVLWK